MTNVLPKCLRKYDNIREENSSEIGIRYRDITIGDTSCGGASELNGKSNRENSLVKGLSIYVYSAIFHYSTFSVNARNKNAKPLAIYEHSAK